MADIRGDILGILEEKIQCPCERTETNMELPLTGKPFYLSDTDMVYLLFEVEKKYGIRVEEKYLIDYGFSTVNRIAEVVGRLLEEGQGTAQG